MGNLKRKGREENKEKSLEDTAGKEKAENEDEEKIDGGKGRNFKGKRWKKRRFRGVAAVMVKVEEVKKEG